MMFPFLAILILCMKKKSFKKKSVYNTIGAVYNEHKTKHTINLVYVLSFWIRRVLCLTMSVLYMSNYSGIQLMILMYSNLYTVILVGYLKPFYKRQMNRLEFFNETLLCTYTLCLTIFTNYCPDFDMKYTLGWWAVFGIGGIFIINLFFMSLPYVRKVKLWCIWFYAYYFKAPK